MKSILLMLLAVGSLCANARFEPDFRVKPDDFTVLMGVDALLSDGLKRNQSSGHGKFHVHDWTSINQSATWKITSGEAAKHEVFVLIRRSNNQPLTLKLDAAGQSLRANLPANPNSWKRVKLDGLLDLPAGESTVTLKGDQKSYEQAVADFDVETFADTMKFFSNWKSIVAEVGERYGERLAGWWFDDGSTNYYYRSAPWESRAKAAKAGDPRGIDALLTPESMGRYPFCTQDGQLSPESVALFREVARRLP